MAKAENTLIDTLRFHGSREDLALLLPKSVMKKLGGRLQGLLEEAEALLRPGFLLKELPSAEVDEGILAGDRILASQMLKAQLGGCCKVYAYVATAGDGELRRSFADDKLACYLLDQLAYLAYLQAVAAMESAAKNVFGIESVMRFCPGTVADWPTEALADIFALLSGDEARLGVSLTENSLILPLQTTAGLLADISGGATCCELCGLKHCRERHE